MAISSKPPFGRMANVGMVQRRNGARFALHALLEFRRRRKMGSENLDRDGAIEACVLGAIDFAHSTRTERRLDFVGAESRAGGQSHAWAQL